MTGAKSRGTRRPWPSYPGTLPSHLVPPCALTPPLETKASLGSQWTFFMQPVLHLLPALQELRLACC